MPDRRAPSPTRLLRQRAWARAGLLASAAATVAVAVATVSVVIAWLERAVALAGDPAPPGVSADEVAAQARAGAADLSSAAPALVILVALLAGTAVAQLARLVAAAREHETATIRARGFSRSQAAVTDAAEGVVVALVGTVVGVVLAVGLAIALGAEPAGALASWPWVLATAVVLAAVFAIALRRGEGRRTTTRAARATTAALIVVVLLASALVVWQLPLARGAGFDPIVAVAPAVVLLAAALVALAVFGAAAAAWARPAAGFPSLQPGYPARQVARRIPIYAVAVLLVALTVAQAVFASAYSATWSAMVTDSAAVRAGADLRVDMSPQYANPAHVAAAASVAGVEASAPASVEEVEIGDADAELVAVPTTGIDAVVTSAGGLVDKAALEATASPDTAGPDTAASGAAVTADPVPLGENATALRVTARADSSGTGRARFGIVALLLDAAGTPEDVLLEGELQANDDDSTTLVAEAPLPEGTAPWRLLAVAAFRDQAVTTSVTVESVEAVDGDPLDIRAEAEFPGGVNDVIVWVADGGAPDGEPGPVTAVVTSALADHLGIGPGDAFEFRYAGSGRRGDAVVSSIADVVPGASSDLAFFAPLENVLVSQLQRDPTFVAPNSVWSAGDPGADVAMSAALDDRPVATAAPGVAAEVTHALVPGWWIATAGAMALSLVAAFAIVQTLAIARGRELGVLRALGIRSATQGRMRAAELGGVFGAALVLGAVSGALASWLIVPSLVRAVTPGILSAAGGISFAWAPLGAAVAVLVAGLAVVVVAVAMSVSRAARTSTVGEESR
ncbi:FtsX-like permease family protein [Microbacterium hibisci]|uniref:FtsX-like permease family protein n=1 Tax=Microbacterium hibisci TaxID=2036000 RepID=UPI001944AEB1|nr:FtsX-like permease family protein [Microbacterium hibisci]